MAFKKAKNEKKYIKIGLYGAQGSGKTATSLLLAEGLAKLENKRIAYIDTEMGTDFYTEAVKERKFHSEPFDFDRVSTRSLSEVIRECKGINTTEHGILIIDSITHLWEAAKNAYSGRMMRGGKIPLYAWSDIKRPYKDLMTYLLNAPLHVIICGRQGVDFEEVDGELKSVGTKMKAEGETAYEPDILINMYQQRANDVSTGIDKGDIVAYFEKDRTGLFNGKSFKNPNFKMLEPLLKLLTGKSHGTIQTIEEQENMDSELMVSKRKEKEKISMEVRISSVKRIQECKNIAELQTVWAELNKTEFKKMYVEDKDLVTALKDEYKNILVEKEFSGA